MITEQATDVLHLETARQHRDRTGHAIYWRDEMKDRALAELLFARPPKESDPVISTFKCADCHVRVVG